MIKPITQTERTLLKRLPKRGHFDRETIYAILDAAFICHVGFVLDGQPFVMPTAFARIGDRLLIHGSAASRKTPNVKEGQVGQVGREGQVGRVGQAGR